MKTTISHSTIFMSDKSFHEMSRHEMSAVIGGSFAENLGYAFGQVAGYFFSAGPELVKTAGTFARLLS